MDTLLKKLNFKDQPMVLLQNLPADLGALATFWADKATIQTDMNVVEKIGFALFFATKQVEIDALVPILAEKWDSDAVIWLVYPKGTSKKYKCDFNRDTGWQSLAPLDIEPVKQVAIDDDWSALRFRKVDFIKKMTRSKDFALSASGKDKTAPKQ